MDLQFLRNPENPLVYWFPPESGLTNGHFWVLKRLLQGRNGIWECSQCGILFESKPTCGFLVAMPHWADLSGLETESCESIVTRIVHAS